MGLINIRPEWGKYLLFFQVALISYWISLVRDSITEMGFVLIPKYFPVVLVIVTVIGLITSAD